MDDKLGAQLLREFDAPAPELPPWAPRERRRALARWTSSEDSPHGFAMKAPTYWGAFLLSLTGRVQNPSFYARVPAPVERVGYSHPWSADVFVANDDPWTVEDGTEYGDSPRVLWAWWVRPREGEECSPDIYYQYVRARTEAEVVEWIYRMDPYDRDIVYQCLAAAPEGQLRIRGELTLPPLPPNYYD